jgi:hypothetical protein
MAGSLMPALRQVGSWGCAPQRRPPRRIGTLGSPQSVRARLRQRLAVQALQGRTPLPGHFPPCQGDPDATALLFHSRFTQK